MMIRVVLAAEYNIRTKRANLLDVRSIFCCTPALEKREGRAFCLRFLSSQNRGVD
jgi:hypothetical protein